MCRNSGGSLCSAPNLHTLETVLLPPSRLKQERRLGAVGCASHCTGTNIGPACACARANASLQPSGPGSSILGPVCGLWVSFTGLLGLVSGMPPFEPCFPAPQARTAAAPARLHAAFSGPAAATTTTPALAALRRPFPSFSDPLFRSVGSCIVSALCALCAALMRRIDRSSGGDGLRLSVEAGSAVGLATRRGDGGRAVRAPGARVSVSEIQAQPTQAAAATEAATAAERR